MTDSEKPFAPACERNQQAILKQLKQQLRSGDTRVLEIGSGTGQHAVYFAANLDKLIWQTADVKQNHAGIKMWLSEAQLSNVRAPLEYQIGQSDWPHFESDVVYCANVLHIIDELLVKSLIQDLGSNLHQSNRVLFYGPFKYQGEYTSESNAEFDLWLKGIDPQRGIRDFEDVKNMMHEQGFFLLKDIIMPANNQLLVFEKV